MKISRREALRGASAAALAAALPPISAPRVAAAAEPEPGFVLTARERDVLRAAANRIVPPFENDRMNGTDLPKFPGAGEVGAVDYVERLLTAFDHDPPRIYASVRGHGDPAGSVIGSRSELTECHGGHLAVPDGWIELPPEKEIGWRGAIARFQATYRFGLAQLDADGGELLGSGFVELPPAAQTALLAAWDGTNTALRSGGVYSAGGGEPALAYGFDGGSTEVAADRAGFMNLLVVHVVEAVYGDPIYGGNRDRLGWKLVAYGGPRHPQGYLSGELETLSPCDTGIPFNLAFASNVAGSGGAE